MERYLLTRHDPYKVMFLMFLVVSSVTQLLSGAAPNSIDALLPPWFHITFLVTFGAGCLVALVGLYVHNVVTGIFMERYGLTVAIWGLTIYGLAVLVTAPLKGLLVVALCGGIIVGFEVRRRQLSKLIRKLPSR